MHQQAIDQFVLPYRSDSTPFIDVKFNREIVEFCEKQLANGEFTSIAKCIIVGDISVGKTSLVRRFRYETFEIDHKATIGVDFDVQKFLILNVPFELQLWDTAGEEKFKCIASSYYRCANSAIIVFDYSNPNSLQTVEKWCKEVSDSNHDSKPMYFIVGSKKDSVDIKTFERLEEEAVKVSRKIKAELWSVSSLTGVNVQQLFQRVAALTFQEMIWSNIESVEHEQRPKPVIKEKQRERYARSFIRLDDRRFSASKKHGFFGSCFGFRSNG